MNTNRIEKDLAAEPHDVFNVTQLTRGTPIEATVGADLVTLEPHQASQTHKHNFSETVLFFIVGEATVFVNGQPHKITKGDRIIIHKGEFHSVSTDKEKCTFISVQTPPILNITTGFLDLEAK